MIQTTFTQLKAFAEQNGFPVKQEAIEGSALGSFSLVSHTIRLRDDLAPLQATKTLVHELGHALMHRSFETLPRDIHTLELEAESCAYLVCDALGLDTSRYSFSYLANWADDPKEILPAAERACKAANEILEVLSIVEEG